MTLGLDVKIKTDVATEPVTVIGMKGYLNIDYDLWDTLLATMISAGRIRLERYTGCSFATKTLIATFMNTADTLDIPYGPIQSITSIKSIDSSGTKTTLTEGTDYSITGNLFKTIRFYNSGIPIEIEYVAGYTDSTLPADLRLAIMKQVAMDFEYREGTSDNKTEELSNSARNLAASYRRFLMF
jgi:uncharacterized phiE125 gp8 family phage protein